MKRFLHSFGKRYLKFGRRRKSFRCRFRCSKYNVYIKIKRVRTTGMLGKVFLDTSGVYITSFHSNSGANDLWAKASIIINFAWLDYADLFGSNMPIDLLIKNVKLPAMLSAYDGDNFGRPPGELAIYW